MWKYQKGPEFVEISQAIASKRCYLARAIVCVDVSLVANKHKLHKSMQVMPAKKSLHILSKHTFRHSEEKTFISMYKHLCL